MSTVVVAIVLYNVTSKKYLIVRRNQNQSGAGFWEFPGGKVERGETPELALQREITEELSVVIDINRLQFISRSTHQYLTRTIDISFYLYEVQSEIPLILVDHDDSRWCDISDILNFQIAAADIPVIDQLKKMRHFG